MFALVESGEIKKYYSGNKGITIGDNNYPKAILHYGLKMKEKLLVYMK